MSSRREHVQRDPRAGVVLEVRYRNAGQFLVSYCTNLSRGGLFISTPQPEPVGSDLMLSLRVPGRSIPVAVKAKVRWNRMADNEDGPAGMGLSFADLDGVLGEHIDRLVTSAAPLRIDLVGRSDHASAHLHALLRSLVNCQTRQLALQSGIEHVLGRSDLVLVDVDGHPRNALALLESLRNRDETPPVLALCNDRDADMRERVARFASVIPTPVDKRELQLKVLEKLGQVQFVQTSSSASQ
ncbi:TIGR02266 family protein [Pseudenhygromyxa sp. WMMC2535]|uniref:TIGR02266 family protein n=1 Tax=Pseudenhygromyxa sp. WMMC2535 TaxID=2712867 RepID=UPI0015551038|nr:TIGR02266 family protein [Pseudenhygromyxa sp. WMMC2535]NVB42083.1 TIGR02266 family protein [Pseudenhygromyxa sp. WMMC2535]